MSAEEYLQILRIAAAHYREIRELASAEHPDDRSQELLDAGDQLDVAIVLAHQNGANLMALWSATRLDVQYLAALTTGIFEP
jgi:hypothetical protein